MKKQEGQYVIKRGAEEFQVLRDYLEGRPLSKIRDVDKKKKVLKVRKGSEEREGRKMGRKKRYFFLYKFFFRFSILCIIPSCNVNYIQHK